MVLRLRVCLISITLFWYSALVGSKLHVSVDNVQPFKEEQTSGENVYSKLKLTTEALDSVRVFSNSDPIIPNIIDDDDYDNDNIMTDHSFADDYREKFLSNGHFRGIDDNEYDSTDEEMDASGDNEIIDKPVVPSPEESIYKPEENANLNIPLTGYEGQPKASTGQPKTTAGQTKATTGQPTTTLGQPTTTLGQPKTTLGQVSHAPGQLPEAATTTEPTTTTESRCSRTMVNFYTLFISVFTVSFFWQKYFYSELIWR